MPSRIDSQVQAIYKDWLNNANPAVKSQLIRSRPVSVFTDNVNRRHRLSKQQRLRIVDQALVLLEMVYVHLPLKRAIHAIDPIQRLRLLRFRLDQTREDEMSEIEFHREIQETFSSVRDVHTQYLLPRPFRGHVAYLPFLVEEYYETENRVRKQKFLVSHLAEGFTHRHFKPHVEVLYWNGVPIRRAIEDNGQRHAGSNPEARFARGLDSLTIRELKVSLPPDEEWVTVTYRPNRGDPRDLKLQWLVVPVSAGNDKTSNRSSKPKRASDSDKAAINQMRKILYVPNVVELERKCAEYKKKTRKDWLVAQVKGALRTKLPSVFRAETKKEGQFGYIRIFTFDPDLDDVGPDEIVNEFRRLILRLPADGLIVDVRGNPGGFINAGERLLQLFTPHRIEPELFEFINTPLTLRISLAAPKYEDMLRFARTIREAVVTSATYSAGFPLTSEEDCNAVGQVYFGPVVLITDALCYSATDIFTAGFQDNNVGVVLGTSGNTGAGGAEVIDHEDLTAWLRKDPGSPFATLPKGSSMSVAVRRSLRVGKRSGRPLEELGIIPDRRFYMTKQDLYDNRDLINRAATILRELRARYR
ncbi:MAG TPA: S41 family peptidase [Blastocatellia bacterium]|nr:S41 family peptidase [Blastocatellia bacterium]